MRPKPIPKIVVFLLFLLVAIIFAKLGAYIYLARREIEPMLPKKVAPTTPLTSQKKIFEIKNQQSQFIVSLNQDFTKKEVEALVKKYGKDSAVVAIVSTRDQLPPKPQGTEGGVATYFPDPGLTYAQMTEYKGKEVIFYFYPKIESIKRMEGTGNFEIEKVISFEFLRALANDDPSYLMPEGEDLLGGNSADIKKYAFLEPFLFKVEIK